MVEQSGWVCVGLRLRVGRRVGEGRGVGGVGGCAGGFGGGGGDVDCVGGK